jgi:hypothetical protein
MTANAPPGGTEWKISLAFAAGNNVGMDDVEILFASTTYAYLVRSEGGEDVSNFNNLPIWAKGEVHFAPIGAFQAQRQS